MVTASPPINVGTVQGLVQGDRNTVNLTYRVEGSLVSPVPPPPPPVAVPPPVRLLPAPLEDLLDRAEPEAAVLAALAGGQPAEVAGEPGVGKSALLRRLSRRPQVDTFVTGAVFLEQRDRTLDDLLQFLCEWFYDLAPGFLPTGGQLLRLLQGLRALVVVDDWSLTHEDVDRLRNAIPGCTVLLASTTLQLTEGRSVTLQGLPEDAGLALLERRLGRPLQDAEEKPAHDLWVALGGHPLHLVQAAGLVSEGRQSLAEVAEAVAQGGVAALAAAVALATTPVAARRSRLAFYD